MLRKKGKELDALKERVAVLEVAQQVTREASGNLDDNFDERTRRIVLAIMQRASRGDAVATRQLIAEALKPIERDIGRVENELKAVKKLAGEAAQESQLAEHISAEAERWAEVHRALGQIEGMLEGVRDRMRRDR